jgi:AP-3 complex subunit delta-1
MEAIDKLFVKSLGDFVRGLRTNKSNEAEYIARNIQVIKEELRSSNMSKKATALLKLTYLQMLGYDISWAAFNVVEVMSHTRFRNKRIGYFAACQMFDENTDVVMLCTNLIKKDMGGKHQYESSVALNCLANICNADLARDLASDVVAMLSSSRPYLRKRAILALYKVFLKFPEALRPAFPRLKERLKDPDQGVLCAAVNVICELARKNPKNYVNLAPTLYQILTTSNNNWLLIKVIKLFAMLCPHEPRLTKKLVDPLTKIINSTPAMSLLYEAIQASAKGLASQLPLIRACVQRLRVFVENPDQNLKYLGLLALKDIMAIQPKLVAEHRDLIFACLSDQDISIRLRAIDLISGIVDKKNVADIVNQLLDHVERSEGSYLDKLVEKIIEICAGDAAAPYALIGDFEWYLNVLVDLTATRTKHGKLIAAQFMDVVIRVKVVRPYGVRCMLKLLQDPRLLLDPREDEPCEALYAAAWCVGEFMRNKQFYREAIDSLLQPRAAALPASIQAVYLQAALKLFAFASVESDAGDVAKLIEERLQLFVQSHNVEVQERACFLRELIALYAELHASGTQIGPDLVALFEEALNPVAPRAQRKVPTPEDLDLDTWLGPPPPDKFSEEEDELDSIPEAQDDDWLGTGSAAPAHGAHGSGAPRKQGPYYLGSGSSAAAAHEPEDLPPVQVIQDDLGLIVAPTHVRASARPRNASAMRAPVQILATEEMPEGAVNSDDEKPEESADDPLASVDLTAPLDGNDSLPAPRQHRVVAAKQAPNAGLKKIGKKIPGKAPGKVAPSGKAPAPKAVAKTPAVPVVAAQPAPAAAAQATQVPKMKMAKKAPAKAQPAPKAAPAGKARFKPLFQDGSLSVFFDTRASAEEPTTLHFTLGFTNKSSGVIGPIEIGIPKMPGFSLASGEASAHCPVSVPIGGKATFPLALSVNAVNNLIRFRGSIAYTLQGESHKSEFNATISCSSFVYAVPLSLDNFAAVVQQNPNLAHTNVAFAAPGVDFKQLVQDISTLVHVSVVNFRPPASSLYGKSIQGGHVALLVKELNDGRFSVDIKTFDANFAAAVLQEITSNFK